MSLKPPHPQKGAMLITMSLFFILLIGMAALAVDVGHLMVARNELQTAADAAALAGANCLNKTPTSSGTDCTSTPLPVNTLNWTVAASKAFSFIGENKADGATLGAGTTQAEVVSTGYKNVMDPLSAPTALAPITLSPVTCDVIVGPCYKPAVQVRLSKTGSQNGGPVQTLITAMFGGAAVPVTAVAVAVISSPGSVIPGSAIPYVINQCMFDLYWDSVSNSPKLATSTSLNGVPQVIGQPWELRIGSSYHYPNCDSGQWTSFDLDANSQAEVGSLIDSNNPTPLAIGDNTWVQPGAKTASYYDLDAKYPTPPGADVTLIVVNMPTLPTSGGGVPTPIAGFAGFHIADIQGGSNKYIQGHFINGAVTGGASGIGPSYGTYTPPRLAQ